MDDPDEIPSPASKRLSTIPSWVMIGFLLGALFVWALPRPSRTPVSGPVVEPEKRAAPMVPTAPRISAIEAIFSEWGRFSVWENDLTEVALWNPDVNQYADIFEVFRMNGNFYFRSIPRFTRPLLTHGVPTESPLQFTETEEQRQRWRKDVSDENKRAFSDAIRDTFVGRQKGQTGESSAPAAEVATPTPRP